MQIINRLLYFHQIFTVTLHRPTTWQSSRSQEVVSVQGCHFYLSCHSLCIPFGAEMVAAVGSPVELIGAGIAAVVDPDRSR